MAKTLVSSSCSSLMSPQSPFPQYLLSPVNMSMLHTSAIPTSQCSPSFALLSSNKHNITMQVWVIPSCSHLTRVRHCDLLRSDPERWRPEKPQLSQSFPCTQPSSSWLGPNKTNWWGAYGLSLPFYWFNTLYWWNKSVSESRRKARNYTQESGKQYTISIVGRGLAL